MLAETWATSQEILVVIASPVPSNCKASKAIEIELSLKGSELALAIDISARGIAEQTISE